jgi:hypothetical protein
MASCQVTSNSAADSSAAKHHDERWLAKIVHFRVAGWVNVAHRFEHTFRRCFLKASWCLWFPVTKLQQGH